jgi:hypothetical protein
MCSTICITNPEARKTETNPVAEQETNPETEKTEKEAEQETEQESRARKQSKEQSKKKEAKSRGKNSPPQHMPSASLTREDLNPVDTAMTGIFWAWCEGSVRTLGCCDGSGCRRRSGNGGNDVFQCEQEVWICCHGGWEGGGFVDG